MNHKPNKQELTFLNSSYNFFLDIYEEIKNDYFWEKEPYYRFNRIRDAFLVYSEVLEYEPIQCYLKILQKARPPMEAELSNEYLLFIRNILIHFPFFKSWDEVSFNKELINWSKPGKSIDKFLNKFSGHESVKYRIWNYEKKSFTFVIINFPKVYTKKIEIKLNYFMPEQEGIQLAMSLMYQVLISQVESITDIPEGTK